MGVRARRLATRGMPGTPPSCELRGSAMPRPQPLQHASRCCLYRHSLPDAASAAALTIARGFSLPSLTRTRTRNIRTCAPAQTKRRTAPRSDKNRLGPSMNEQTNIPSRSKEQTAAFYAHAPVDGASGVVAELQAWTDAATHAAQRNRCARSRTCRVPAPLNTSGDVTYRYRCARFGLLPLRLTTLETLLSGAAQYSPPLR